MINSPETEFLFEARVKLLPPLDAGSEGHRVIFFVKEGTVQSPAAQWHRHSQFRCRLGASPRRRVASGCPFLLADR